MWTKFSSKIVSNNFKRSVNLGWLKYVFLPISNQFDCYLSNIQISIFDRELVSGSIEYEN